MALTRKQWGVLRGMLVGSAITIAFLGAAILASPISFPQAISDGQRVGFALKADLLLAFWLLISIGRLARYRFFTPQDIDGGGLTQGTDRARILQATLQNTVEQTLIAVLVHMIWAVTMPLSWLATIPAAAILFLIGRILFVHGYSRGAPSRALGFALTFYPTVLMFLIVTVTVVLDLVG